MNVFLKNKPKIKEKLAKIPQAIGIYYYKDKNNRILYIGKAKNIQKRVKSYFNPKNNNRIDELLRKSDDLGWLVTLSESDALVLEDQMIKKNKPKYNVRLRDDKSYPYIKISTSELYPRMTLTREAQEKDSHYFGPYTSAKDAKFIIETLRKKFPLRTSKMKLDGTKTYRPCINFQMKKCLAPCNGEVDAAKYRKMVLQLTRILKGNADGLIKELQEEMKQKSTNFEYEEAAKIRDKILTIQNTTAKQVVLSKKRIHRDLISILRKEDQAGIQLLFVRSGILLGSDFFYIQDASYCSDEELLRTVFSKLYLGKANIVPSEIILSADPFSKGLEEYFAKKKHTIKIIVPKKGEKKRMLKMCLENAENNMQSHLNQELYNQQILKKIKQKLRLKNIPYKVECFDISNIQGKNSVASMVVMENNRLCKKDYRKYKIKTVKGIDDTLSMREVLQRRWNNYLEKKQILPDLTILDGGKGQLSAVYALAKEMKIPLEIMDLIAIAKGRSEKKNKHTQNHPISKQKKLEQDFEYLLKPEQKNPIYFTKNDEVLLFFKKIRDEAHRFAVQFHRQQREKESLSSPLQALAGIGDIKRKKLLQQFKNIENIRYSSLKKLQNCSFLNKKDAENIYNFFQ